MNHYQAGNVIRCSVAFSTAGAPIDPSTVTFRWTEPGAEPAELIYGTDDAVIRSAAGAYHIDLACHVPGTWQHRFAGSGEIGQSAAGGAFTIDAANV